MKGRLGGLLHGLIMAIFPVFLGTVAFTHKVYLLVSPNMVLFVRLGVVLFGVVSCTYLVHQIRFLWMQMKSKEGRTHSIPNGNMSMLFKLLVVSIPCLLVATWKPLAVGASMFQNSVQGGFAKDPLQSSAAAPQLQSIYTAANPRPATTGADAAYYAEQGAALQPPSQVSQATIALDATKSPNTWLHQRVSLVGFVYHPAGVPSRDFVLTRFFVFCCVADASPIGVAVQLPGTTQVTNNEWVEVQGFLEEQDLPWLALCTPTDWASGTNEQPIIISQKVQRIAQPALPYLVPMG